MRFDLDALSQASANGAPLLLPLASIDEDPSQPRTEFDPEPLQQLADSIAQRGVLQAISVRRHPDHPDRWMLNFGARRLRASKLAGRTDIPATVNETATSYDQVIENEQREGLKPLELALFVRTRLALGENQAEIARRLGKSQPYITYVTALIDAPDWLMDVYQVGKCTGMAELYHLRRLHAQASGTVQAWIDGRAAISRSDIQQLKRELGDVDAATAAQAQSPALSRRDASDMPPAPPVARHAGESSALVPAATSPSQRVEAPAPFAPPGSSAAPLFAEHEGRAVEIVLDAVPVAEGHVFVRKPGATRATEVAARDLVLVGFGHAAAT